MKETAIPKNDNQTKRVLEAARSKLLDLTRRNRLISFKPGGPSCKKIPSDALRLITDIDKSWPSFVDDEDKSEILSFTQEEMQQAQQGTNRFRRSQQAQLSEKNAITTDPAISDDEVDQVARLAKNIKSCGLISTLDKRGPIHGPGHETGAAFASTFEEAVCDVSRRAGFQVVPQVGEAGYFIDLAVRHPKDPGKISIGIECDGATYHSSRAARDRDHLREAILVERGWNIYRIWSTGWFGSQARSKQNLNSAIKASFE